MPTTPQISFDVDGTEAVSSVLLSLLNTFPGLGGREIKFSVLGDASGVALFPTSGAAILSEKTDVAGYVEQTCLYPFILVYRSAPNNESVRIRIKEFLDTIGKWLERQPVEINGVTYQLASYPEISSGIRTITKISRTEPAHIAQVYQDNIEDWSISATLRYENEYESEE